jgi:hypothetical protein
MRFMIIVKGTPDTEAGKMPEQDLVDAMAAYHEEMAAAGMLVDASGLQPTAKGFKIRWQDGGKPVVIDGPFTESKEIVAGFTIIEAASRDEAVEWTKRFPNPMGEGCAAEIEVRQLYGLEDFEDVDMSRFVAMDLPAQR